MEGVYEGGLKIWECSIDLADFLYENLFTLDCNTNIDITSHIESSSKLTLPPNSSILELGCGHGLPAIATLMKFSSFVQSGTVVFTDFNKEVIEKITWPNILQNYQPFTNKRHDGASDIRVRCFHGDWDLFARYSMKTSSTLPKQYGLIISAETLYTTESCLKVYSMMSKFLCVNGMAVLASKRYYFGVGGGIYELESIMKSKGDSDKYKIIERRSFEDGRSNIRDIVVLKRVR